MHPRQLDTDPAPPPSTPTEPSGASTAALATGGSGALSIDATGASSTPDVPIPTLTVTDTSSSSSPTPTQSSQSNTSGASKTSLSTGAIVAIALSVFAVLAVLLVIAMLVRSRSRRSQPARRRKRETWTQLADPAEDKQAKHVEMRAVPPSRAVASVSEKPPQLDFNFEASLPSPLHLGSGHAPQASLASGTSSTAHLIPSGAHPTQRAPSPDRNPFTALQRQHPYATATPSSPGLVGIPNPFSGAHHDEDEDEDLADAPAERATDSVYGATTDSIYGSTLAPSSHPPSRFSAESATRRAPSKKLVRRPSDAPPPAHAASGDKAMADLISALDQSRRAHHGPPAPSAFRPSPHKLDTGTGTGASRLSRGEGLVTPGGHSMRDRDSGHSFASFGSAYPASDDAALHASFPLPPADVFRAALALDKAR